MQAALCDEIFLNVLSENDAPDLEDSKTSTSDTSYPTLHKLEMTTEKYVYKLF